MLRVLGGICGVAMALSVGAEPASTVVFSPALLNRLKSAQPEKGESLAASCQGCHAPQGMAPNLEGQLDTYLYKELMDYRSGARQHTIMSALAQGLSDQDVIDIAAFYSHKPLSKKGPEADAVGASLVHQGDSRRILPPCSVCHQSSGVGQKMDVPAIRGQKGAYLVETLKAYKQGTRHNDLYGRMRAIAGEMSDAEIEALGRYYGGTP